MDRNKIINISYLVVTLILVGMVVLSFIQGFDFLIDYYILFAVSFIVWMVLLFTKMNEDRKRRKRKFDPFRERRRDRENAQ